MKLQKKQEKGFFVDRVVDRRRNHFDYRGDRYPELASRQDRGQ